MTENSPSFKSSLAFLSYFRIFCTIPLIVGSSSCSAEPLRLSEIDAQFVLTGRIAHDHEISGITKLGNSGILVSDEDSDVQILTFDNATASVVGKTPLLANGEEADLEAVAVSNDGWFFACGSHGVSKKRAKRAPSRENVFRFRLFPEGIVVDKSISSLTPYLLKIPELRPAVGRSLKDDGLNIEGLAISGNTLYFGLRRPRIGREVLIVEIPSPTLFDGAPGSPKLHRIAAHPGNGIRALETLADGTLLLLLGGKKGSAFITLWNPLKPEENTPPIIVPASEKGGKAESIVILDQDPAALVFAVAYDSIAGGGARTFRLSGAR